MKETLSLSWDAHQRNICGGLSLLQQKGEFVDMTLAADGHLVKVHQMVVSLASPFIKELISSAQCPHPVIFLNNISHTTLTAVLEYVYTGEVHIVKDGLADFLAAGKALHIKGLRELDEDTAAGPGETIQTHVTEVHSEIQTSCKTRQRKLNEILGKTRKQQLNETPVIIRKRQLCEVFLKSNDEDDNTDMMTESIEISNTNPMDDQDNEDIDNTGSSFLKTMKTKESYNHTDVHYSMSNQGNLQLVVNRFIYNLKYVQKNLNKYWRCVDYGGKKCPASIYTNDGNTILKRKCTHNHPFHDIKILKKIRGETIFKAFSDAEGRVVEKKEKEKIELVSRNNS